MKLTGRRIFVYIIGLIILALGIDLNTKTCLGISPIISVPYNISSISGAMLGAVIFIYYCLQIFLQWLLDREKFSKIQLLQIPCAFITSLAVQVFDSIIPTPSGMVARIVVLILAICVTGLGAAIVVAMKIVPNPADGLANVVGTKLGHDFGFGKNVIDFVSIIISFIIGFVATGGILGIGIGTVIAMIFTGRVIALLYNSTSKIYQWTLA